jgi:hypothetical protein
MFLVSLPLYTFFKLNHTPLLPAPGLLFPRPYCIHSSGISFFAIFIDFVSSRSGSPTAKSSLYATRLSSPCFLVQGIKAKYKNENLSGATVLRLHHHEELSVSLFGFVRPSHSSVYIYSLSAVDALSRYFSTRRRMGFIALHDLDHGFSTGCRIILAFSRQRSG